MKLPALKNLSSAVTQTFIRFPFAVLCAIVGTVMAFIMVGLGYEEKELQSQLMRGMMTMYLGMLSGITCTVFCERYFFRSKTQYIFNLLILLFMHYYFYTLPDVLQDKEIARFIVLALSAHLALAFAPFLVDNEPNGFWHYNKQLFLRILSSVFYSHVLFIGLSLALLAVDNLFNADVNPESYVKLYIIIIGLINTVFFLAGVPEEVRTLEGLRHYPKGLRIFTQFVLLPLIALYFLILYIYGIKIIATQIWPEGWVAWLVLGFSASGILAFLLSWPLRFQNDFSWIKKYSHLFFAALVPLIILLFAALWKRVDQYGITEHRYFVFIFNCWLVIMSFYFLLSPVKNIKIIPLSLFIACLITAYGPWSAFEVAERSQHKRLVALLEKNSMLHDSKAVAAKKEVEFTDRKEISATVDYLIKMHGLHSLQNLFSLDLDSLINAGAKKDEYIFQAGKVLSTLNIDYTYGIEETDADRQFAFAVRDDAVIATEGYSYALLHNIGIDYKGKAASQDFKIDSNTVQLSWNENDVLTITVNAVDDAQLELSPVVKQLKNDYGNRAYEIPPSRIQFIVQGKTYSYKLLIRTLNATLREGKEIPAITFLGGYLLIKP